MTENRWLQWVQTLQTIAQAGLTYTQNPFDRERYHRLMGVAAEILAAGAQIAVVSIQRVRRLPVSPAVIREA